MINFFRKIRRDLIANSKSYKYFKYAIGEIILVVIGILIALQINTWNEERKAQIQFDNLIEKVQKELLVNIKKCNLIIENYSLFDSLYSNVINKKVTYNDYESDSLGVYSRLITRYEKAELIDNAFHNLIEFNSVLNNQQDSIISGLRVLNDVKKNIDVYDQKMIQFVMDFIDKSANEIPTFSSIRLYPINDELIKYFVEDPIYLNRVFVYWIYAIFNHLDFALDYRLKAIEIHNIISEYLGIPKQIQLNNILNEQPK